MKERELVEIDCVRCGKPNVFLKQNVRNKCCQHCNKPCLTITIDEIIYHLKKTLSWLYHNEKKLKEQKLFIKKIEEDKTLQKELLDFFNK